MREIFCEPTTTAVPGDGRRKLPSSSRWRRQSLSPPFCYEICRENPQNSIPQDRIPAGVPRNRTRSLYNRLWTRKKKQRVVELCLQAILAPFPHAHLFRDPLLPLLGRPTRQPFLCSRVQRVGRVRPFTQRQGPLCAQKEKPHEQRKSGGRGCSYGQPDCVQWDEKIAKSHQLLWSNDSSTCIRFAGSCLCSGCLCCVVLLCVVPLSRHAKHAVSMVARGIPKGERRLLLLCTGWGASFCCSNRKASALITFASPNTQSISPVQTIVSASSRCSVAWENLIFVKAIKRHGGGGGVSAGGLQEADRCVLAQRVAWTRCCVELHLYHVSIWEEGLPFLPYGLQQHSRFWIKHRSKTQPPPRLAHSLNPNLIRTS